MILLKQVFLQLKQQMQLIAAFLLSTAGMSKEKQSTYMKPP